MRRRSFLSHGPVPRIRCRKSSFGIAFRVATSLRRSRTRTRFLKEFGDELTDLRLVPGPRGAYDVEVDGKLVFSLDKALRFPETSELIRKIRARIKPRKARKKA